MVCFQHTESHTGSLITAFAAIGGVLVGSLITFYMQLAQLRLARIREKLDQFYAPMMALRSEIKAKSETRLKLNTIANNTWQEQLGYRPNSDDRKEFEERESPSYEKIFSYSTAQVTNELVPPYRKMLEVFTSKMQYAEDSTRKHYENLVEFVELWNRQQHSPLPPAVVIKADHDESKQLYPLYDDVKDNFDRLRKKLERPLPWS